MLIKKRMGGWGVVGCMLLLLGCVRRTPPPHGLEPSSGRDATLPSVVNQGTAPLPHISPERRAAQPVLAQAQRTPRRFSHGEVLYIRHCADCHGWEGQGNGPVGQVLLKKPPPLRRPALLTQNTEAELVARILLGKDLGVSFIAEAIPNTETEVAALLTHLRRLPTIAWTAVAAGQEVYDALCVSCHGIYGRGDGLMSPALSPRPRDLSDPSYQQQVSDEEVLRIISEGRGAMPGAAEVTSIEERRAVITFIRLLSPGYELYDRFCEVCHGAAGIPPEVAQQELFGELLGNTASPAKMPVFNKKYVQAHTDEQLRGWVRHMLKQHRTVMPHFGGDLNAEDVRQILSYLRSLPS